MIKNKGSGFLEALLYVKYVGSIIYFLFLLIPVFVCGFFICPEF